MIGLTDLSIRNGTVVATGVPPSLGGDPGDTLLLESGDDLLLESGDYLLLE